MATITRGVSVLTDPADVLLADVGIRVQLSSTDYDKAVARYRAINDWIERDDSPLRDRVELLYPQGSMAVGATIASRLRTDEFDIDVVAQLDLPADVSPEQALGLLYRAIKGRARIEILSDDDTQDAVRHRPVQRTTCTRTSRRSCVDGVRRSVKV